MVMSVIGLAASLAIVIIYFLLKAELPGCSTNPTSFINCDAVLGSKYSEFFGVPLEFFIVNLILVYLVAFGSETLYRRALTVLFGWRFLGLIIVPYLISIELFIINHICVYCTTMHAAIVLDFIIITYFLFYKKDSLYNMSKVDVTAGSVPSTN
jgi:uncharacterized membrane protein